MFGLFENGLAPEETANLANGIPLGDMPDNTAAMTAEQLTLSVQSLQVVMQRVLAELYTLQKEIRENKNPTQHTSVGGIV